MKVASPEPVITHDTIIYLVKHLNILQDGYEEGNLRHTDEVLDTLGKRYRYLQVTTSYRN